MADGSLTANAEAPLTQAQTPGTFWEECNVAERKLRIAWITGSAAIASPSDRNRARRNLEEAISCLQRARDLLT